MDRKELDEILRKHKEWIEGRSDGERANLRGADLRCANLSCADLCDANLCDANLSCADLCDANLSCANLRGADLSGVDLSCAVSNHRTAFLAMACPEEGAFIGFKKAGGRIVKLLIPEDAKRSSATTRKCRCSKAKVLSITELDGSEYEGDGVASKYDSNFIYRVGEMVEVPNYDENRWNECSAGIHFFITRDEAVKY